MSTTTPDDEPRTTVAPGAWMRLFASTLVRLYPSTDRKLAEEVARRRHVVDRHLDPTYCAELFALDWGAPVRVENAKVTQ